MIKVIQESRLTFVLDKDELYLLPSIHIFRCNNHPRFKYLAGFQFLCFDMWVRFGRKNEN